MQRPIHPLHAVLLAGTGPLFLGVLLSDIAYSQTYQVQWKNFASWLIVGAMVFAGVTLLWALVSVFRRRPRAARHIVYALLLLAIFILGFINGLVHARDAWASMPSGLILSAIIAVLVMVATALGFSSDRAGAVP